MKLTRLLLEAEYTHIGYGKYKEKGKEKDSNSPTFKKDDSGKFIPIKSNEPAASKDSKKDTPRVNIFDKPKEEPKQNSKSNTSDDRWGDRFELGTPAVYNDNGKEYSGEVVMNPSNQQVQINGKWTMIGKGTHKGIQVYGSDTFIIPDDWNDVKGFNDSIEEPKSDKSSEPDYDKYTNKSQTMTDFFKGNLSIDDLKKVADKNFGSEIATEKDLDGFLNNKFMQDVMADEHGVDRETLVSKVKDLKTSLFGGDNEEPKKDEPKSQPKQQRKGNPAVNKATLAKAEKLGITPQKLGKEEYEKKMAQAAIEALTDSNYHTEARELVAKLEGKPEMAERPVYPSMKDPKFKEKMAAIRTKYASEYTDNVDRDARDLGISASQEAGWGGVDAADSIAFTLRMNGFHKLADTIQSVVQESYNGKISLKKL